MRPGSRVYRFGDFELRPATRRLLRGGVVLALPDGALAVLICLVQRAPAIVDKDTLITVGWKGAASLASLEKALSQVRRVLGDAKGSRHIESVYGEGYRFVTPVVDLESPGVDGHDELGDEPLRAYLDGRRKLATLHRQAIAEARCDFARAIRGAPAYGPAHVALAMAAALSFDGSRFDAHPDLPGLTCAVTSAHEGTRLDPASAEAWSTLGFALSLAGDVEPARVAALKAVALDPHGWPQALRLAYVSWGEDRLQAAHAALTLRPQLALAYWLQATVFIARGAFDAALTHLRAGCAAQDVQPSDLAAYPAVGLHLLRALVLAAQGRLDDAIAALETEFATPQRDQIYAQECAANSWYALGAIRLRQRQFAAAETAFLHALDVAPAHVFSLAALGRPLPEMRADDPRRGAHTLARVIALARGNRHREAARLFADGIAAAPALHAGWTLPVEPVLEATIRPELWGDVLIRVQQRAT